MRLLFVAGGSAATVFALSTLAKAARVAGHQVLMAANDAMMPAIAGVGLPGVSVCAEPISHFIYTDRFGAPVDIPEDPEKQVRFTGEWFARMSAAWLGPLRELAAHWRPDAVVGGSLSYSAQLLAAELGVAWVRHAWDAIETDRIDAGARAELVALGFAPPPEPDLFIDVCPPSLRPPQAPPGRLMRWVSGNGQGRLERWMYARGERPRVCLTAGSRVARDGAAGDFQRRALEFLRGLAAAITPLDAEVVIAAPDEVAAELRDALPGVRAGWIPLDVVAPTCDVIVHHGGGVTGMTALAAGTPQVIIPQGAVLVGAARRLADRGAAITVRTESAGTIAAACGRMLADRSFAGRARELAREIASLPSPAEVAGALETVRRRSA